MIATVIAAIILMGFVILGLSIGKLLTGKSRFVRGTCGRIPQKKGEKKKKGCSICGSKEQCEDKNDDNHTHTSE